MICRPAGIALLATIVATPAALAQETRSFVEAGVTSDYRVRGLSWSDGRSAANAGVNVDLPSGFNVGAWGATARGASRHGGADAAVDLIGGYAIGSGALRIETAVIGKFFPGGRGNQDYFDTHASVGGLIGPLDVRLGANYAPDQAAIGGDNLYLRASGRLAWIGTPLTLTGHVGRSSGDVDDPARAWRLRPGGNYRDWSVGFDYSIGPIVAGLAYTDTDVNRARGPAGERLHAGSRIAASLRFVH
jgi:uncharacterized protein (TIGR02001 family)